MSWHKEAGWQFPSALDDAVGAAANLDTDVIVVEYVSPGKRPRYALTTYAAYYQMQRDGHFPYGSGDVETCVAAIVSVPRNDRHTFVVGKKRRAV